MGGELPAAPDGARLRTLVSALKDPGAPDAPGTDLQRIQLVKGWLDAAGKTHERVIDVAGDAVNGAWVDEETCAPTGVGAAQLCAVWEDPDFDPASPAFYYARVLENPSCSWSTRHCLAAGVNSFSAACETQAAAVTAHAHEQGARGDVYGVCCQREAEQPFLVAVIQECAWTSPIWYRAAGAAAAR